jgi:hypothetical protein
MNSCNNVETKSVISVTENNSSTESAETQSEIIKYDMTIMLGCGVSGEVSEQLEMTNSMVRNKDYKTLINNLSSKDLLTQLLSVIALDQLDKKGFVRISTKDKEVITRMKSSNKTYFACEGCTEQYSGTITDIFDNKDSLNMLKTLIFEIGLGDY